MSIVTICQFMRPRLLAGLALLALTTSPGRAQSDSPFGVNSPTARTASTVGSLHSNMVGRQRAVSAEIVHNTPDRLSAVYNQMYFTNQARLYSVGAHGSMATEANRRQAMILDNMAYEAIQARETRNYVTRSRGGYMNPGGLTGSPGADLLFSSPQAVKAGIENGTLPPGWSVASPTNTGFAVLPGPVLNSGFAVSTPISGYGYGFAPSYGPR